MDYLKHRKHNIKENIFLQSMLDIIPYYATIIKRMNHIYYIMVIVL